MNTQVNVKALVTGFDRAYERLQESITKEADPDEIFLSIFEALHWVVAAVYYAQEFAIAVPISGDDWLALRYARNRADHQWGMALRLADDVPFHGGPTVMAGGSRRIEPEVIRDWVWIDDGQLPPPDPSHLDPSGQRAYIGSFQGKPAREVLERFSAAVAPLR